MPLSHKHKTILVHVPKTAGTSMEYVLGMHGPVHDVGMRQGAGRSVRSEHNLFGSDRQHYTALQLRQKLGKTLFEQYFVFAFVRNPWARVVSDAAWANGASLKKKEPLTQANFEHYVQRLQRMNINQRSHTRPQYRYVCDRDGKSIVDFVGHYEKLDEDWAQVCARLNIQKALPQRMQSTHHAYRQYYTPQTRAIVARLYAKDIALFGYTF